MKISIISPSFNQAAFLPRLITSVSGQSFRDYEHVIFDGGSSDGSDAILREYAESEPRVRLTIERDRGQAHAINKGFAAARGDILTWINSDDYYHDDGALAAIAAYFEANPNIDVAYGRGLRVDAEGKRLSEAFLQPAGSDFAKVLQHSLGVLQPSVFFRRAVFEAVGGLSEAYNLQLDYEYWIRIAQRGFRWGFVDRHISKAVVHVDAKSTAQRMQQLNECVHLHLESFGYLPQPWAQRYAEFYVTRADRKVEKNITLSEAQRANAATIERYLLGRYNNTPAARAVLEAKASVSPHQETLTAMKSQGSTPPRARQIVITSFDSAYLQQGLNLIASLHRTSYLSVDKILVYSLGLAEHERERLNAIEKVEVIDYPAEAAGYFPEFLDPKSRAYKPLAIRGPADLQQGDLVLWMDAGVSALQDIQCIFDRVRDADFFITDHDDRSSWPFYNITFAHPQSRDALGASNRELLSPHLCSCIIGYRRGGRFQNIIDEAFEIGKQRAAVVWPKTLKKAEKKRVNLSPEDEQLRARLLSGEVPPDTLPRAKIESLFEFLGHRTQSIYSVLCARYGAPSSSAKIFHRSNDQSSTAAAVNWERTAKETDAGSSRNLADMDATVVIYHHRGVYNNLDGLRYRRPGDHLFILGNGPSLAGFPFEKIPPMASLGMNAAYRFWDETGFYPTYYCCFDDVVMESHREEIARLINERKKNGIQKFFLRSKMLDWYPELAQNADVFFLEQLKQDIDWFGRDKITTGSFSVLVGYFLGFRNIYLLGIDLNYVEVLPETKQEGRILEIAADPEQNPNYFFAGYQRKGDRYNPPNRHPGLHNRSWTQIREITRDFPLSIVNLNPNSGVRDFPFDDFATLRPKLDKQFSDIERGVEAHLQIVGEQKYWRDALVAALPPIAPVIADRAANVWELPREAKGQINECKLVFEAVRGRSKRGIMIDVGAHFGGSLHSFLKSGWTVYAFEPDPKNREPLIQRYGDDPKLIISTEAVSDRTGLELPFFASDESTGISGLSAFRDTHREVARVKTVTLDDVAARHKLDRIDFLKIDVEGFEMSVLQGLNFQKLKPRVVLAEFEDGKTAPHGYSSYDLCNFFVARGYTVYVSEWHPIERYGGKHSWRRVQRYPCAIPPESWGNLVAFIDDPGEAAVAALLRTLVECEPDDVATPAAPPPQPAIQPLAPPPRAPGAPAKLNTQRSARGPVVLLGNGPALRGFDFKRLVGFDTIGLNAAYRHWDTIGFRPTYYACLDTVVGLSHKAAIARLANEKDGPRQLLIRDNLFRELGAAAQQPHVLNFEWLSETFSLFEAYPLTTGSHAALWAALLGYREIVVMGVDAAYVEEVKTARPVEGLVREVVNHGANPNYYFDEYQKVGDRFHKPNSEPGVHLNAWKAAAALLAQRGIRVWNASPTSKLDLFERRSFEHFEAKSRAVNMRRD